MARLRTPGLMALAAAPLLGCGNSTTPTQAPTVRALVRISVPQQVAAEPSTDPRYAAEATISIVASESAGVGAYIAQVNVRATDEATGVSIYPPMVRLNATQTVPARGSVELPLRVYLPTSGSYRARVILKTYDAGGPAGTVPTGGLPADGSVTYSGEPSNVESEDFEILPPQ
jgi:hypothetical protein